MGFEEGFGFRSMGMEYLLGQMVLNMKEIWLMESNMAKDFY